MTPIDMILLIGLGLTFLAVIVYLIITRQWAILREAAYRLMLRAEKLLTEGSGKEKFALVITELYSLIPAWFRLIVSREDLEVMLQRWYDAAKDWLDDGTINGSTAASTSRR